MMLATALGLVAGVGLLLCLTALLQTSPPLWIQIAPYVGSTLDTRSAWQRAVARVSDKLLVHRPKSLWGSDHQVTRLLRQAARTQDLSEFRQHQIRFAGLSTLGVGAWLVLRMASPGGISPMPGFLLFLSAPIVGGWYAKWTLANAASERVAGIEQQLPTVLDLLAFALAAGQAILPAIKRIGLTCGGDLAEELAEVVIAVSTGTPLAEALNDAQARVDSEAFSRSIRSLVVALERGTPLALVLRAQADDARSTAQRQLMELASKKETAMMLPVVFFILPMIVVVALYPGLIALQMM